MAAPTNSDLKYYDGADANPANNTDPLGGAIDTGSEVNEATANTLIQTVTIGSSDISYRGVVYRKNTAAGSLDDAFVYLRTGGELPGSAGVVSAVSTSAADTGSLWIAYKSGGNWIAAGETITMTGLSTATGLTSVDSGSDWLAIYASGTPPTGDISIFINSVKVGVIYGTAGGNANYCASTLYQIAVATAQNTALSSANRLTDPTGIGSYARATYWPGNDSSVAIPGTDLGASDYFGYVVKLKIPGGMTKPPNGEICCDVALIGDPVP